MLGSEKVLGFFLTKSGFILLEVEEVSRTYPKGGGGGVNSRSLVL